MGSQEPQGESWRGMAFSERTPPPPSSISQAAAKILALSKGRDTVPRPCWVEGCKATLGTLAVTLSGKRTLRQNPTATMVLKFHSMSKSRFKVPVSKLHPRAVKSESVKWDPGSSSFCNSQGITVKLSPMLGSTWPSEEPVLLQV